MSYQHKELAQERWQQMPLVDQMANMGSEVDRYFKWREKENPTYSQAAFERFLELLDLTLADPKNIKRLKEITRIREAMVDFFLGTNDYSTTAAGWIKYFNYFAYASRRKC